MPTEDRWSTEENTFLMEYAYRVPWSVIAAKIGRTEEACKKHHAKIVRLRKLNGTWRGL